MLVTFFRSSSFSTWDFCEHSYLMSYGIGKRDPGNKKAILGSITHKALELLARQKLSQQIESSSFRDEESDRTFQTGEILPDLAIDLAFDLYSAKESRHNWSKEDREQCREWMWGLLKSDDGMWDPRNRKVICPEQYFDFPILEEWAKYHYVLPDGRVVDGYLGLKGTVDLITEIRPGYLEYLDWKTGKRLDWATGAVKDWKKLRNDPQLRIYHYALSKLYPDIDDIMMTIVFLRDGGPFSLPFDRSDLKKTEDMLRKRFNAIRNSQKPRLKKSWRCTAFCHYGKNNYEDTGKTICEHFHGELETLGMDRLMAKYANFNDVMRYADGGGRSNRDAEHAK